MGGAPPPQSMRTGRNEQLGVRQSPERSHKLIIKMINTGFFLILLT